MARLKVDKYDKISMLDIIDSVQDAAEINLVEALDPIIESYGVVMSPSVRAGASSDLQVYYDHKNSGFYVRPGTAIIKDQDPDLRYDHGTPRLIVLKNTEDVLLRTEPNQRYYVALTYGKYTEGPTVRKKTAPSFTSVNAFERYKPEFVLLDTSTSPDLTQYVYLALIDTEAKTVKDLRHWNTFNVNKKALFNIYVPTPKIFASEFSRPKDSLPTTPYDLTIYYGDKISNLTVNGMDVVFNLQDSEMYGYGADMSAFYNSVDPLSYMFITPDGNIYHILSSALDTNTNEVTLKLSGVIENSIDHAIITPGYDKVDVELKSGDQTVTNSVPASPSGYSVTIQYTLSASANLRIRGSSNGISSDFSDIITVYPSTVYGPPQPVFNLNVKVEAYANIDNPDVQKYKSIKNMQPAHIEDPYSPPPNTVVAYVTFNLYSQNATIGSNGTKIVFDLDYEPILPGNPSDYWVKFHDIIAQIDEITYDSTNKKVVITTKTPIINSSEALSGQTIRVLSSVLKDEYYIIDVIRNRDLLRYRVDGEAVIETVFEKAYSVVFTPEDDELKAGPFIIEPDVKYQFLVKAINAYGSSGTVSQSAEFVDNTKLAPDIDAGQEEDEYYINVTVKNYSDISGASNFLYFKIGFLIDGTLSFTDTFNTETYQYTPPVISDANVTIGIYSVYTTGFSDVTSTSIPYTAPLGGNRLYNTQRWADLIAPLDDTELQDIATPKSSEITMAGPMTATIGRRSSITINTTIKNPILQFFKANTSGNINDVYVSYDEANNTFTIYNHNRYDGIDIIYWIFSGGVKAGESGGGGPQGAAQR